MWIGAGRDPRRGITAAEPTVLAHSDD